VIQIVSWRALRRAGLCWASSRPPRCGAPNGARHAFGRAAALRGRPLAPCFPPRQTNAPLVHWRAYTAKRYAPSPPQSWTSWTASSCTSSGSTETRCPHKSRMRGGASRSLQQGAPPPPSGQTLYHICSLAQHRVGDRVLHRVPRRVPRCVLRHHYIQQPLRRYASPFLSSSNPNAFNEKHKHNQPRQSVVSVAGNSLPAQVREGRQAGR
jgi:hypothetical protein